MEMAQHGRHAGRAGQGGAGVARQLHGLAVSTSMPTTAVKLGRQSREGEEDRQSLESVQECVTDSSCRQNTLPATIFINLSLPEQQTGKCLLLSKCSPSHYLNQVVIAGTTDRRASAYCRQRTFSVSAHACPT